MWRYRYASSCSIADPLNMLIYTFPRRLCTRTRRRRPFYSSARLALHLPRHFTRWLCGSRRCLLCSAKGPGHCRSKACSRLPRRRARYRRYDSPHLLPEQRRSCRMEQVRESHAHLLLYICADFRPLPTEPTLSPSSSSRSSCSSASHTPRRRSSSQSCRSISGAHLTSQLLGSSASSSIASGAQSFST